MIGPSASRRLPGLPCRFSGSPPIRFACIYAHKHFCGDNKMLKAAKRVLRQIRGLIVKKETTTEQPESAPDYAIGPQEADLPTPQEAIDVPIGGQQLGAHRAAGGARSARFRAGAGCSAPS